MASDDAQLPAMGEVIGQLQEAVLQAVLLNKALPGSNQSLGLADLSFALNQTPLIIAKENLADSVALESLSMPVEVVSQPEISERALMQPNDVAYLQFQAPVIEDDSIQLTLHVRLAAHNAAYGVLGLSGVQVRFKKIGEDWVVVDAPQQFAA